MWFEDLENYVKTIDKMFIKGEVPEIDQIQKKEYKDFYEGFDTAVWHLYKWLKAEKVDIRIACFPEYKLLYEHEEYIIFDEYDTFEEAWCIFKMDFVELEKKYKEKKAEDPYFEYLD